jgi:hypothetical protein
MAGTPFQNAAFAISVQADASLVYNPSNLYPAGALQVDGMVAAATVSIAGVPSAIVGFSLNVTLMNDTQHNLHLISVGSAPDQLVLVKNPALQHYNLKTALNPTKGTAPFPVSARAYPLTNQPQTLQFSSIASAQFQATLIA